MHRTNIISTLHQQDHSLRSQQNNPLSRRWKVIVLFSLLSLLLSFVSTNTIAHTASMAAYPSVATQCFGMQLLFVGDTNPLTGDDAQLVEDLSIFAHTITVRSDDEVTTDDATGMDLIVISESVESALVNRKFRDVAVPLLTWEGWLQDDLGMVAAGEGQDTDSTVKIDRLSRIPSDKPPGKSNNKDRGTYGEILDETTIQIIDSAHPLAAGYTGQVQTVLHDGNRFHWGKPNGNAAVAATARTDQSRAMIYSYDSGDAMVGLTAPARRVFIHNASAFDLTTEGLFLFFNAVHWTQGCLTDPSPTATATQTLTPSPTPTATPTATPSQTSTSTVTSTSMPTNTPTPTEMPSATATPTSQPSHTPTTTSTPTTSTTTETATATSQPTESFTATNTATATSTPNTTATATLTPTEQSSATPESTPQVTATPTATQAPLSLLFEKRDLLFIDSDEDGLVSIGDTLLYVISVVNHGGVSVQTLVLQDKPEGPSILQTGSVQSSHGTVVRGNQADDTEIEIRLDSLPINTTMQVSFQVQIGTAVSQAAMTEDTTLTNQATLTYAAIDQPGGQSALQSDDPDTAAAQDTTTTPLGTTPSNAYNLYLPVVVR